MPPAEPDDALAAEADALYALAPEEFTAARNARAKAVQADGDRSLAQAIRGLARPSAAAGLANQLVRRDRAALDPLLELGTALRAASARLDGPQLRTLSRQQGKVVAALVRRAGELSPSGKAVSPGVAQDLDETFRAAIADADATDLLLGGCLTAALQHNGFGLVAPGNLALVPATEQESPAAGSAGSRKSGGAAAAPSKDELRSQRLAAAEQDLADARAAAEVVQARQVEATQTVDAAQGRLAEAKGRLEEVREELERAKFALSRAEGDLRQAKQSQEQVERAARAARNGLDDAIAKRDKLAP